MDQIKGLLEELMFLVRTDITSTPQELSFSLVTLKPMLQQLSQQFETIAQEKAITWETKLSEDVLVKGDRIKLIRLFSNILENALNYSHPGDRILLSMQLSWSTVIVSIKDSGMGIATENSPHVFQDFWRSDQATSRHPQGYGLGLTIAQTIAQQHRGKILVKSQVGVGSCFQVALPRA